MSEQLESNGMIHIDGEWVSKKKFVQLESGDWVKPEKAEELEQHLAERKRSKRQPDAEGTPLTDTGNAELMCNLFGDRIRYDHRRHRWLVWRDHRWEPDRDGQISRLAVEAARNRYNQASLIADLKARQQAADWAISSESRQKIDGCISLARNIKPIAGDGENWDRDPCLLGVNNGVVDLRTGELRPGQPEDRITMTTGVEFNPEAKCPRWERFLTEVFGDADFVEWLQRALGYSTSGDTTEQCIFIGYGVGGNGKGVFNGTMAHTLGDYAYTAPFSTFELYQRAGIPNDLAALEFKRLVSSSETNDNTRLNEARLKAISGCDPITARYLHQEFFTFWPHLKLWLFVNHKPKVTDDSFGFWRRVRLIPFTKQFTGKADDRRLSEKLRAEAPGILAWLVRGYLEWQRRGLDPVPECVKVATQAYQQESDPLAGFIEGKCVEQPGAHAQGSELYKAYKAWAEAEGMVGREVMTSTTFGQRMGGRYQKGKSHGKILYQGIGISGGGRSGEGLTLNDTKDDVLSIESSLRERTRNNPPNYPPERENLPQVSPNYPGNGQLEASLGMPVAEAISMWHSNGSPIIHLGAGENCSDLEKLLTNPTVKPDHLQAIKKWLEKVGDKGMATSSDTRTL